VIGVALALIAVGIGLLFVFPLAGIPLGIAGLVLFVAQLAGFGQRTAEGRS
jgi:hypothetical protein